MTLDLSEVVNDEDLGECFVVLRSSGKFVAGGWSATETAIDMFGVVTIASGKDLAMVPEGDRVQAAISVYSATEILLTHEDDDGKGGGTSDVILWQGERYRVMSSQNYGTRGFWHAVAVRMKGA